MAIIVFTGNVFDNYIIILIGILRCNVVALVFFLLSKHKFSFKRIVLVALVFLMAFILTYTYKSYKEYLSSFNSSIFIEKYEASSTTQEFLPFYDNFYDRNPDKVEYAVIMSKNNIYTEITVSNNFYLSLDEPAYSTIFTRCSSISLLLKSRFEMFKEIMEGRYHISDTIKSSNKDLKCSIYTNDSNSCLVTIKDGWNTYISEFLYLDKIGLEINDFLDISLEQYYRCLDLSKNSYLPDPDNIYESK